MRGGEGGQCVCEGMANIHGGKGQQAGSTRQGEDGDVNNPVLHTGSQPSQLIEDQACRDRHTKTSPSIPPASAYVCMHVSQDIVCVVVVLTVASASAILLTSTRLRRGGAFTCRQSSHAAAAQRQRTNKATQHIAHSM